MSQRKSFLVLGAGLMGRAIAFDLINSSADLRITLADGDVARAREVASRFGKGRIVSTFLDVRDRASTLGLMSQHAVVISAVPFHHNLFLTQTAIEAGSHFCDLGHDNNIVLRQIAESEHAQRAGVTIIANCGLAPGLADILAMNAYRRGDRVDSLQLRVGGLPQHPHPPFNYQLVFSVEGLVEEYPLEATILRKGKIERLEPLTEIESLAFQPPFDDLEAFHTGGGASRLPQLLEGKVQSLEYKTIRYRGHCAKMKTLLELGFAGNEPVAAGGDLFTTRELFLELLKKRLTFNEPDVVLMLVSAEGERNGKLWRLSYRLIDRFDAATGMTAMMRTTSFPTSIIAQFLLNGTIEHRGAFTAEEIVPLEPFMSELKKRKILIETEESA